MTSQCSLRFAAFLLMLASAPCVFASNTTTYTYDALGRLRTVTVSGTQASVQSYDYDAAGNRTLSTSGIVPSVPPSISVPGSSITGSYTISWGAATGTVTAYELYQATNASFSGQSKVYSGSATSSTLSGRGNGTYYYRVRACSTSAACSGYRTGGNSITVTLPPGTPASIGVPSGSITGSYTISWGTSTGNVTAYELQEATNSSFTGATLAYTGTATSKAISGKGNGAYYYRVRACNTSAACSGYRAGTSPTSVTLPPSVPGAATVPSAYNNTGAYAISWGASTRVVTAYELLESVAFGSETLLYSGTALSTSVSAKADGVYSYRLRACNTSAACSGYTATQGNGAVIYVDKIAPAPPASLTRTGQTNLIWSGGSTDTAGSGAGSGVDRWRVYRSGALVGTVMAPMQSFNDSTAPSNQTYTYTVRSVDRAGNESANSPPLTVYVDTIAPNAPTGVSAVGVSPQSIQITWNAAVDPNGGTITSYLVYRNGANQQLASGTSLVDTGLTPSTTYTYTVVAYDSGSNASPASAPANGTTQAPVPTVPLVPTNVGVSFSRYGHPSYTVYWTGSGAPTSYYVLDENGTTYTVTGGLTSKAFSSKPAGFYSYKVKACSATNVCSAYSSPSADYEVCGSGGCQ